MSVVALCSLKASPGVTTTALALAATWPSPRDVLLVEADADGGDLAARFDLRLDPGLATLAASARRAIEPDGVWRHVQRLPGGVPALVAPASADQARSALSTAPSLGSCLAGLEGVDVLVDCGRLTPGNPAEALARSAGFLLVVCRPRLDEIQHVVPALPRLRDLAPVALVAVGRRPYAGSEVAEAADVELAGAVETDPRAARALATGAGSSWWIRRSLLVRSAQGLAERLCTGLDRREPPDSPPEDGAQIVDDRAEREEVSP